MKTNISLKILLKYFVLIALLYMPIFGFLNTKPIRLWDESRLAINAYEMYNNGNFIVTHFNGKPDMWNTKPPLLIWLQTGFMHLIGVNELAVRLPSAIAAFFLCLFLLYFSIKFLKSFWLGFIIILVLITSHGYINFHATRTGDYDSLLTLFTTLYCITFFYFIETKENIYLYLFYVFLIFSVLTKSITGLLFLPALLIYVIYKKQFIFILKNKHTYIGLFVFIFMVVGYYLLREIYNHGYISAVYKNELGGRYLEVVENHKHSFWYYYNNFIDFKYKPWYIFIPAGLISGLFIKNKKINDLTLFAFLNTFVFFIVISTSQTKLEWYDVPLYPFISILAGIFIYSIFYIIKLFPIINRITTINIFPYIFLFFIFITPYQKIIQKTYKPVEYSWDKKYYNIEYYLKDAIKGKHNLNNTKLLCEGYNAPILFYLNILHDKKINLSLIKKENIEVGDKIIFNQKNIFDYVNQHFKYSVIESYDNLKICKIYEKRKKN